MRTTTLKYNMRKAFYYLYYQKEITYLREADRTVDRKYTMSGSDISDLPESLWTLLTSHVTAAHTQQNENVVIRTV